jgi:carboxymethylenebutenolidase
MKNKDITIGKTPAYHVYPDDGAKHPGLIVIHEIWGLNEHVKDVANRFAKEGYSVLAPDLFHDTSFETEVAKGLFEEMHNPETRDEAQKKMRALFAPIQAPEFAEKTLAQLDECVNFLLADEHNNGKLGVIGFCFGGTYALALAAADSRINASVPFYGQPLSAEKIPGLASPVLAFLGEEDQGLIASLPALKEGMQKAGKDFKAVVYPGAGHAFFNDTNPRMYRPEAAKDAWKKTLDFLAQTINN